MTFFVSMERVYQRVNKTPNGNYAWADGKERLQPSSELCEEFTAIAELFIVEEGDNSPNIARERSATGSL